MWISTKLLSWDEETKCHLDLYNIFITTILSLWDEGAVCHLELYNTVIMG